MIVVSVNSGSSSMRLAAYALEQRGRLLPLVTQRFAHGEDLPEVLQWRWRP